MIRERYLIAYDGVAHPVEVWPQEPMEPEPTRRFPVFLGSALVIAATSAMLAFAVSMRPKPEPAIEFRRAEPGEFGDPRQERHKQIWFPPGGHRQVA